MQKFYRVAGGSTQFRGVVSDVRLPSVTDNNEFGESALQYPLAYSEVKPAPIDVATNRKALFVDELRQRSLNRVNQEPEFQDILDDLRRLDERLKINRLSLNETIRRDEMAKDEKQREKEEADRKKAAADNHNRTYELTLSEVDKQLKLAEQKSDLITMPKSTKAKPMRSGDNPMDDDGSASLATSDPQKREALNILSDLVELAKSPRTVGR